MSCLGTIRWLTPGSNLIVITFPSHGLRVRFFHHFQQYKKVNPGSTRVYFQDWIPSSYGYQRASLLNMASFLKKAKLIKAWHMH